MKSKKNTPENVNISGQVFVVTKGRDNIKLALVEVVAIPEKEITEYIKAKYGNGLEQQDAAIKNLKKITSEFNYFNSPKYYFEELPAPLAVSKTDADGKFALSLPSGKYALAAKSSRDAVGTTENYYWLVWVDTSSPNHSVMLSNDNFFETACVECVKP